MTTQGTEHGPALRIPHEVSDIAERVQNAGERIPVQKDGRTVAVLVPTSDIAALEALEERLDLLDALDALADYRERGGLAWADLKSDLGI
ncbi:MAG: hypothetical protein F4X64_06210 [Chloroflexi bacterium]|nr:hypothetical protein [Chloroflexota bacterium]